MPIISQENWSGHPEGAEVQAINGWSVFTPFPIDLAKITTTSSGLVVSSATNRVVIAYDAGTPNYYVETEITSWNNYQGQVVRVIDDRNYIGWRKNAGSDVQIIRVVGGTTTILTTTSGVNAETGHTARLEVVGNVLKFLWDGVQYGGDVDISGMHESSTSAGLLFRGTSSTFGALEVGNFSSKVVGIDPAPTRKVIPVFGATKNHTFTGTFSGDMPVALQGRIQEYVSGDTVVDWVTFDSSPVGGVWSWNIDVPKGKYYKILVRYSDDHSAVTSSDRIGFGFVIWLNGQSNSVRLFGTGGTVAPLDDVCIFDTNTTVWGVPTTESIISALNVISAANDCVVAVYNTAVNGSSIDLHLNGGANYAVWNDALTAVGGKINGMEWLQGESDVSYPNYDNYYGNLSTMRSEMLASTGQLSSEVPLFIGQLGRNAGAAGSAGWNLIRTAQTDFANASQDVYIDGQTMDLPMSDSLHRDTSGQVQTALRFADSFNSVFLGTGRSGRGVIPSSASVVGSTVEILHDLNGSSEISIPANAKDLYDVSIDNFSTFLAIDSISTVDNKVILTLAATPASEVRVRSLQDSDPDLAKMPTGTVSYNSQSVMVEPIVTSILSSPVTPSVFNLTATGIPNGDYSAEIWDNSVNPMVRLSVESLTFTNNIATLNLTGVLPVDSAVIAIIDGSNPPETGVLCYGVTE